MAAHAGQSAADEAMRLALVANADVKHEHTKPRLTDPMFERWLQTRGLTPTAGDDNDNDQ